MNGPGRRLRQILLRKLPLVRMSTSHHLKGHSLWDIEARPRRFAHGLFDVLIGSSMFVTTTETDTSVAAPVQQTARRLLIRSFSSMLPYPLFLTDSQRTPHLNLLISALL